MQITQVKVHLTQSEDNKLKAFVTLTFDDMFVVRDLKIIEGKKGLFVAMPSVKMKEPCLKCHKKVPVRSKFCSQCGAKLPEHSLSEKGHSEDEDRKEDHRDIAHPITVEARDYIQTKVLEAYEAERKKG
ncbi:MAG: septation protein SpoVG family protein [Chlamydiae bacterium]|nr:septation protein SpoVG family protein [Chlamydiota bacterium]MBI3266191.1 septation protein SpoVG family protein [Chlamydiota bacterium]